MTEPTKHRYVTNEELKQEISELKATMPTRWEVRFLIVVGLIAAQVLPASDIARAAIGAFP